MVCHGFVKRGVGRIVKAGNRLAEELDVGLNLKRDLQMRRTGPQGLREHGA